MEKIKLENFDKIEPPYTVPQGYFQKMEQDIQKRMASPGTPHFLNIRWALVPVILVLLFTATRIFLPPVESTRSSPDLLAGIPEEEILEYLAATELSVQEIAGINPDILDDMGNLNDIHLEASDLDDLLKTYDLENLDQEEI